MSLREVGVSLRRRIPQLALHFSTVVLVLFVGVAHAQFATGVPPFSSFTPSSFDQIDNANLDVHFQIPVLNKAGRGLPFAYNLTYDSLIWSPVNSGGNHVWTPAVGWFSATPMWGWSPVAAIYGVIGNYTTYQYCYGVHGNPIPIPYVNYEYWDQTGALHNFNFQLTPGQSACGVSPVTSGSGGATDGSGYSMVVNQWAPTVYSLSGVSTNGTSMTDSNGNTISGTSSFTDTLGAAVLTITGSGTPSSPQTYTYTAPNGNSAAVTVKYQAYIVKTNFGCSGFTEFGPTSENLVSEIDRPDGSKYTFQYEPTPGYSGDTTARISQITLPTGGTITYAYTGANDGTSCSDGTTTGLSRTTSPGGVWSYSRGNLSGSLWQTTIMDPQGNQTSIELQGIYEVNRQVYQGTYPSGQLLETVDTCYNGTSPPCEGTAVTAPITTSKVKTTINNQVRETDTSFVVGLPTDISDFDYSSGAPGPKMRETAISYWNGTNKPSAITVRDGGTNQLAQTTYSYDETTPTSTSGTPQHAAVSGARGNLTTTKTYTSSSTFLTKHFSYYDTGNVYQATDVNNAITTYTYGACGNSFPTQVSLPLGLSTSATWDCVGGVQLSATDPNGKSATTTYSDPYFWRPAAAMDPLSNVLSYAYYTPAPGRVESHMFFNGSNSIAEQLTTVDGFGRVSVAQRQQAPGVNNFDTVETDYDALGRPSRTTFPYFSNSYGQTNPNGPGTSTTYDALNRPLQISDGGGGYVSYTYNGNDVLQTVGPAPAGEHLKQKQLEYDALGRLVSVCEITTGSGSGACGQINAQTGYWTKYAYDFYNGYNRVTVTQNAQSGSSQTRTYLYDLLGRLVQETNPESGTTTFFYDTNTPSPGYNCQSTSAGDMVKSIDANGNTMCYAYDSLHRLAQKFAVGPNNPQNISNYYVYDVATVNGTTMGNTKGKIAEAYTATCYSCSRITDEGFSYDADGNETDSYESTPSSAGYYHVNATYWPNGAVDVVTGIPGFATITYGVDGEGRPSTVSASSGQNPVTATSYDTAGEVTGVTFGSGDSDSYQFDPYTGRMTQYLLGMGSLTDTGNLTWNANGSLGNLTINDQINSADSQNCSYLYDDLERLASASCGSVWNQSFGYDPFGNITKSGSSAWQPGYNSTTNQYTLSGTSYDADGNLLADTFHNYTWDAYGQLSSVDGTSETYDALGRMVMVGNVSLVMAPFGSKPYAFMAGQTLGEAFVPLPGGGMMRSAYGYRHGDWLGSVRLLTSFNRTLVSDLAHAPFGESYAHSGTATDLGFTQGSTQSLGQISGQGLFDFVFRKYHSGQGRWISPDPAGLAAADPTNPQSWNRYAYVMNNPLANVDPLGLGDQAEVVCSGIPQGQVDADSGLAASCTVSVPTPPINVYGGPAPLVPDAGWQNNGYGAGWAVTPFYNISVSSAAVGGGSGGSGVGIGPANNGPAQRCTEAQQSAANLARLFDAASSQSGWIAFGTGTLTIVAGIGEEPTFGLDTPVTVTAASVTTFFATTSTVTGAFAAGLNSFANGNMTALRNFNYGQLASITAKAAASRIPIVKPWADRVGDLAEKAVELGIRAREACQ